METFLATAAIAAITAISIIAYRHPKGYEKIFKAITNLILWAVFLVAGYAVGAQAAHHALIPYLRPDKVAEAAALVERGTPDPSLTLVCAFLVWGYFAFLSALPIILEHTPDDKKER